MSDDDVVVDYKKHSRRRVRNVSAFVLLASALILSCHITLVIVAKSNRDMEKGTWQTAVVARMEWVTIYISLIETKIYT